MRACQGYRGPFRIVQHWGREETREATPISTHDTEEAAFAEIDRLGRSMARTEAPGDPGGLIVVDRAGAPIARRAH